MRTVNEQKRGLYRELPARADGVKILLRIRKRLYGVEWTKWPEEQRRAVVGVAAETVTQILHGQCGRLEA